MDDRHAVAWPSGERRPDPWDDVAWPSLDTEARYADLWTAWEQLQAAGPLSDGPEADRFAEIARQHGLTDPLIADRNTPDWDHPLVSLADLARITTDTWPAAGMDAPDAVLGPRSVFAPRLARLVAVAGCAFVWTDGWPLSSFHLWCRGKPLPSAELRATVRAVGLAPWALWRVDRREEGVHLVDHTGLGEVYLPHGPVQIVGEQPTGEGLAARVHRTGAGWVAHTAVDVPHLPSRAAIDRWLEQETWMARTVQPGVTREALLRKRPVLVRRALEACPVL